MLTTIKRFKKKWKTYKFSELIQGVCGFRLLESCRLTLKQLETIRRVFVRLTKREGKFFIRLATNQIVTKKSKGSRMGKGTGSFDSFIIDAKAGQIVFEFSFFNIKTIKNFIAAIKSKLPSKTVIVYRNLDYKDDD